MSSRFTKIAFLNLLVDISRRIIFCRAFLSVLQWDDLLYLLLPPFPDQPCRMCQECASLHTVSITLLIISHQDLTLHLQPQRREPSTKPDHRHLGHFFHVCFEENGIIKIEMKWNLIGALLSNNQGQFSSLVGFYCSADFPDWLNNQRGELNKIASKAEASNNTS